MSWKIGKSTSCTRLHKRRSRARAAWSNDRNALPIPLADTRPSCPLFSLVCSSPEIKESPLLSSSSSSQNPSPASISRSTTPTPGHHQPTDGGTTISSGSAPPAVGVQSQARAQNGLLKITVNAGRDLSLPSGGQSLVLLSRGECKGGVERGCPLGELERFDLPQGALSPFHPQFLPFYPLLCPSSTHTLERIRILISNLLALVPSAVPVALPPSITQALKSHSSSLSSSLAASLSSAALAARKANNRDSLQRKQCWWLPYVVLEFDKNEVLIESLGAMRGGEAGWKEPVWRYSATLSVSSFHLHPTVSIEVW